MCQLEGAVRDLPGVEKDAPDGRAGVLMVAYIKAENNLAYRGLASHSVSHTGDPGLCGLKKGCQKSCYQLHISQIDPSGGEHGCAIGRG